jgi:hypothetical protein
LYTLAARPFLNSSKLTTESDGIGSQFRDGIEGLGLEEQKVEGTDKVVAIRGKMQDEDFRPMLGANMVT